MYYKTLGRVIASYHKRSDGRVLVIINVYVPCAYPGDGEKFEKKMTFLEKLKAHVSRLIKENNDVVVAGDLNVKSRVIDSAEAFENRNDPKFLAEWYSSPDKILFNSLLDDDMVDCQKYLHPNMLECYTCWNTQLNGRINNYGTRIDYILVSRMNAALIKSCSILSDIKGSDHCPFLAEIDFSNILPSVTVPRECTMFYPELRGKQTSLSSMLSKRKADKMNKEKTPQLDCHVKRQKGNGADGTAQKQGTQTKLNFSAKHRVLQKPQVFQSPALKKPVSNEVTSSNAVSVKSLLRGLPPPPLCSGHQIKSSLKTVTKDGPNLGKKFYCCSLSIGPSSSKTSRCNFFQWLDK
jgi:AP endonuclease-2